jgi:hypothetical protein
MKLCVHCNHSVSRGDRHSVSDCPPAKGSNGWRRRHKARLRSKAKRDFIAVQRGVAVAGIHKKRGNESK